MSAEPYTARIAVNFFFVLRPSCRDLTPLNGATTTLTASLSDMPCLRTSRSKIYVMTSVSVISEHL